MSDLFDELYGVDFNTAVNFFFTGLKVVTGKETSDEMIYVASILAHYSLTPRYDDNILSIPPMADLSEVSDKSFLLETKDPKTLETVGSQLLFLDGFFRDWMSRSHNVKMYDDVGQSIYDRASFFTRESKKRELFGRMSESFPSWAISCCDLSRDCRNNQYLLGIN
jgi:hypothetical protein